MADIASDCFNINLQVTGTFFSHHGHIYSMMTYCGDRFTQINLQSVYKETQ